MAGPPPAATPPTVPAIAALGPAARWRAGGGADLTATARVARWPYAAPPACLAMSPSACSPTLARSLFTAALALVACEPLASSPAHGGDTTTGTTGTTTVVAGTHPTTGVAGCDDDVWEPNPDAARASQVAWESADAWSAWRALDDLYLCPGDEDWYAFDLAALDYEIHAVYIRALVADAGLCGADCDETVISTGPQHAMTLEVYRGDTTELLMTQTADDGVLVLDGYGDDYARGLRVRVHSPTAAGFPYRLTVNIRNYEGEDECEC